MSSIKNKFDSLVEKIKVNIDLLMISERKIDNSFPPGQCYICGFGLLIRHNRENIVERLCYMLMKIKLLSSEANPSVGFYVEMNLCKKKWLIDCSYNPEKENISKHTTAMRQSLELYSTRYENIIVLGGFNVEVQNKCLMDFCKTITSGVWSLNKHVSKIPKTNHAFILYLQIFHIVFKVGVLLRYLVGSSQDDCSGFESISSKVAA